MKFAFELTAIICKSVLSGADSPWGKRDGIRVYFLVATPSGFSQVMRSGREFPPPDSTDNYFFFPGKTLNLSGFPPENRNAWQTDEITLGETDSVAVAVVGVNEGLPYIAGGGGPSPPGNSTAAFEEAAKKMGEEASKETGGPVWAVAWEGLKVLIDALNKAPECQGTAFVFMTELSMKKLLQDHLLAKSSIHTLSSANAGSALAVVAMSKHSQGCGAPDYEVTLKISRVDSLRIDIQDVVMESRQGDPTPFVPLFEACKPRGDTFTFPVFYDRRISFVPSHFPVTLKPTWYINDIELIAPADTIHLTTDVGVVGSSSSQEQSIALSYRKLTVDGIERLIVETAGEAGNYKLEVSLRMNFEGNYPPPPNGPWATFRKTYVWVTGQELDGNDAYYEYMKCMLRTRAKIINYLFLDRTIERPGPIEIGQLERGLLLSVNELLNRTFDLNVPLSSTHKGDSP